MECEALAPNNTIATAIRTYLPQLRGLVSGIAHPIGEATKNPAIADGVNALSGDREGWLRVVRDDHNYQGRDGNYPEPRDLRISS